MARSRALGDGLPTKTRSVKASDGKQTSQERSSEAESGVLVKTCFKLMLGLLRSSLFVA